MAEGAVCNPCPKAVENTDRKDVPRDLAPYFTHSLSLKLFQFLSIFFCHPCVIFSFGETEGSLVECPNIFQVGFDVIAVTIEVFNAQV